MARTKKSEEQKQLSGTARPDRTTPTPNISKAKIRAPRGMKGSRAKRFKLIAENLSEMGLRQETDDPMVAAYANEMHRYEKLMTEVEDEGEMILFNNGKQTMEIINPKLKIADAAFKRALSIAKEFGLTPKSRASLVAIIIGKNEEADYDEFDDM